MRMLLNIRIPHEPFNTLVRDGSVGDVISRILEAVKPEAVYFTEQGGGRGAVAIVNVDDPSQIPALAEPWFLMLNADCEFRVVMLQDDLRNAGLAQLGAKWR
ncbi:panthothenate synthetase [Burkholderia cepacia]|uniref:panthothenate synthetase n=1 Tax=Burkholderia cepacia TaxID=292 RepID=UPI000F569C48|nr:panthothenate synthetase [Burkholderia cepacia]RQT79388.1 panthothenate synthetase [Burkholderia cepacia]